MYAIRSYYVNSAECYGLKDRGAVAPGYKADFIIVSDLERVKIEKVFKNGELVAENGECIKRSGNYCSVPKKLISSLNFGEISKSNISISIDVGDKANIIEIIPNKLETRHVVDRITSYNVCYTKLLRETGLYVYIDGEQEDGVAFRADMDALEIEEKNDVSYSSEHKGRMHACGHDGHMSILLGFVV